MQHIEIQSAEQKRQNPDLPIEPHTPWLAPLAGWSDLPFRLLCREQGANVACTEMVSAKGLVYGGRNTQDLLQTNGLAGKGMEENAPDFSLDMPLDNPLVVQIFGAESDFMQKGVQLLKEQGFTYFDVNVGCSVNKVVKTGAGSAMLKDLQNFFAVAKTVINEVHGDNAQSNVQDNGLQEQTKNKIGFKIRLGYHLGEDVYQEVALCLQDLGADWITLHPRYAKQAFSGTPNYEALARLKELVQIPVIASGDLFTARDGIRVLMETGVDAVMYARGAMANPRIFAEHKKLYSHVKEHGLQAHEIPDYADIFPKSPEQIKKEIHELIQKHLHYAKIFCPHRAVLQMRTIVPRYVKHLENAKLIRQSLIQCRTFADLENVLQEYFGDESAYS